MREEQDVASGENSRLRAQFLTASKKSSERTTVPIQLLMNDVRWSREQGHPVLVMDVSGESNGELIIVLSPGDAQMLATKPVIAIQERMRLIALVESLAGLLRAPLTEVRFRIDSGLVLTADLKFGRGPGQVSLSANFADAVVLATRSKVPMFISEQELRQIRASQEIGSTDTGRRDSEIPLTSALNSFIESLQLDDLTGPQAAG